MKRLADALDYAPGALYRYFSSKDALLAEVQRSNLHVLRGALQQAIHRAAGAGSPETSTLLPILCLVDYYARLPDLAPERFQLLNLGVTAPRQIVSDEKIVPVAEASLALVRDLAALLDQASAAGDLQEGNPLDRALVLWSSVHGVLQLRKIERFDPRAIRPRRLIDELTHTLLCGWGASPGQLQKDNAACAKLGAASAPDPAVTPDDAGSAQAVKQTAEAGGG
jgi:AcrR family transcriptional regulator